MTAREKAIAAHRALVDNTSKLSSFGQRGISVETVRAAWVGYDAGSGAFTYPCITRGGGLLGIHYKGEGRDEKGKRRQWWGGYAEDLPAKGHGKKPDDPAKVIPFGLETLTDLKHGTPVILCCGEEDALSVRQAGYTGVSQAGAGLLEPAYAKAFEDLEVVVFYDAGEENEARLDATKLLEAGVKGARVVVWPTEAPHGSDINGKLVEDPEGFEDWLADMIAAAKPPDYLPVGDAGRDGDPDTYVPTVPEPTTWPVLDEEALCGLPGDVVKTIEPHTEADPVAILASLLAAFGNAIGRGAFFRVGADLHHLKLNVALVGDTSKGRKGMSWAHVRELMGAADERWTEERVLHGLSSGAPTHVQHVYREMQDRGLSTRTVQYTHAVLRRALKQAKRWGMVDRNVAEDVDPPRLERDEIQPLNREQTRRLLEAAEGDRLHALYVVAVTAGLRPGEILALRWSDVDLGAGTLQINRALSGGEFAATKTPRSRRKIELSNTARAALRAHRKRQLGEKLKKAGLWKDHGLVFPSTVGTPLSHRNVVRSFKALLKRAGLPASTRLYDLRHTCATLLLNSNVHPKYVQELLGHASISQTLDTYSHVLEGMDGGIGDAMDAAVG